MTQIIRRDGKQTGYRPGELLNPTTVGGRLIRNARVSAGLSQVALAERVDLDPSYVSKLESGSRIPSRDALRVLARAIDADVSLFQLAGGFLPDPIVEQLERRQITPQQVRAALLRGLSLREET